MKQAENEKKEKKSLKELWSNPFSKAGIKLGLWGLFFIIVYIFIFIDRSSNANKNTVYSKSTTTTTAVKEINYNEMKNNLLNKDQEIKYRIGAYYLTGNIKSGELFATLEDDNNTYKIKYDGSKIYKVKKEELILDDDLLKDIRREYLLPGLILEIINNPKNIGIKSADNNTYSYDLDKLIITVYLSKDAIDKIIIKENDIEYNLEYKEISTLIIN